MSIQETDKDKMLAFMHGAVIWNTGKIEFPDIGKLTAMLDSHRQQVIKELAAKAGVMPKAHGKHFYASWEVACDANEVREAIAAMQAQIDQVTADWREATRKNRQLLAKLLDLSGEGGKGFTSLRDKLADEYRSGLDSAPD